ncbi:MAG TPA: sialidase family protein [Gemmatimonadales bacterium]
MRTFLAVLLIASPLAAQRPGADTAAKGGLTSATLGGLRFRGIGPAMTSGRVSDIAIHPADRSTWYIGVASGGVWKTVNAGTTWTPIFDDQPSYSIGALTIDPNDPLTIWVGTGENNSQRSVGYGDGVYRSTDGGRTWKNMGLKTSGNIGRILVDPRDSKVVWVAAQGGLWSSGGERGVYKTTDAGTTWVQVLKGDNDWTGAADIQLDPRNPDAVYAALWQRARRQWGFINGGPGSGLHKTTDGGATWQKLTGGLPSEELGKTGLAVSPADPGVVYALVEAANREGGLFRSSNGGSSWRKMSSYNPGPPMYYTELIADPKDANRVYSVDVQLMVSADSGRTMTGLPGRTKHVDHHALWINPDDPRHLITGNDGGLYQSFDQGATWQFAANLPITQFYKVALDNDTPFYNVYGGTQDNNTLGGPSQTRTNHGITNQDWFVVVGGDGFGPAVDPTDPNIVYGQWQHGELVRFDRKTGERVDIQPQPAAGEPPLRWHWDSPLLISPHSHTRLYFAANRLFRSDDRGDSWRPVSPDLTRQIDRNRLRMMGRVWSPDAVAKNTSTSFYGAIVAVAESPRQEGLLYAGTDDGLIQVSEDGGQNWRMVSSFPGVPDTAFVADIVASRHDAAVAYAVINNHKAGDFRPYVVRTGDKGRTWAQITGDLPARGSTWSIAEDPVKPGLLFAGTEFGVFVAFSDGGKWIQMKGGLPTIPVRDIAIQERDNDLVLATFGRGFYILDDYSPLRRLTPEVLAGGATLLPTRDARMFIRSSPLGGSGRASQGDAFYVAPNPPDGAAFTWYLKDGLKTARDRRRDAEKAAARKNEDVTYPAWDQLRAEEREEAPAMVLTVSDEAGNVVRRITGPAGAGLQRVHWNLRYPSSAPVTGAAPARGGDDEAGFVPSGPLAAPGTYAVQLGQRVDGIVTPLGQPQTFRAEPVGQASLPPADRKALLTFQQQTARLQRAVLGSQQVVGQTRTQLQLLRRALDETPAADPALRQEVRSLEQRVADLATELSGDQTIESRSEPGPVAITDRVQNVIGGSWNSTSPTTGTHRRDYDIAAQAFGQWLPKLRQLVDVDLRALQQRAEAAGVPWTPGRVPEWKP